MHNIKNLKLDHINLAVPNIKDTINFYTKILGFTILHQFTKDDRIFVFMTDGNIVYEFIQKPVEKAFIDHIAYVSEDIEKDYLYYKNLGLTTTEIGFVDFLFENGVKFFFIKGAGEERIEFCQKI
ncbi:MAG: VOC family protein [bacterium]